jgi:hypothetical protein
MLVEAGYAIGMFGKWHLGQTEGRFPTDQGFDEWYGIPNSTDEIWWPEQPQFNEVAKEGISPYIVPEYIYEGKKGSTPSGEEIFGVKWRNWKMLTKEFDGARGTGRIVQYGVPYFYNLYNDPKELYPVTMKTPEHFWVRFPMAKIMSGHLQSLQKEPPIKPGTPDPYVPAKKQ